MNRQIALCGLVIFVVCLVQMGCDFGGGGDDDSHDKEALQCFSQGGTWNSTFNGAGPSDDRGVGICVLPLPAPPPAAAHANPIPLAMPTPPQRPAPQADTFTPVGLPATQLVIGTASFAPVALPEAPLQPVVLASSFAPLGMPPPPPPPPPSTIPSPTPAGSSNSSGTPAKSTTFTSVVCLPNSPSPLCMAGIPAKPRRADGVIVEEASARPIRINRESLSQDEIASLRGLLPAGDYWYDSASGLYGTWNGPAMGVLPAGLKIGGALTANASAGSTGVFANGRELPVLEFLAVRWMAPVRPGRYWLDSHGNAGREGNPRAEFNLLALMRSSKKP